MYGSCSSRIIDSLNSNGNIGGSGAIAQTFKADSEI